jgi:3-hydroxyisobutyrate dehydrogenase
MRYGFIGVGHLGAKLAGSLLREGFALTITDINKKNAAPLLARGARWADTPKAVASECDAVFTCLPSPAVSESVLCGREGILEGFSAGGTLIEMSTLGRDDIVRLAGLAAERGVLALEAPVTGGVHRAAGGGITILVGGDKALFDAHRPALQAMGGEIFHMGPLGSAALMKVITNMLAFIHLVAAGEALMLAKRGGLDLAQTYHAIKASSGNSFVHETESQLVLNGSYKINFTMERALKDLGFAMAFGKELGVPLDLAALTTKTFIRAEETYGSEAWSTMVVKLLEDALKTDLRASGFPAELNG